ncbi:hypothetical protein D1631_17705 [Chryseobacterium nematophagum]|uniref:Uncharacterized protein n=1 Tax=Chryseobacterium nematophagum TaxID=2305228 RepID=A0A3M7TKR5_9FLAO|nr:hypothetical protein [Chryseobacterium nematophagum]RNA63616.1 hypothetical protein D1631_17705 [Chryseobacterium nematophagum]
MEDNRYKLKQVCVQNPIFGPRNLGHYWGSMKDFVNNQYKHESYLVIDDIMAILMNPKEAHAIKNRTYFVLQDFINCGYDTEKNHVVLTSSYLPYIMEIVIFYADFIDYKFCNYLYENSFLGGLKSYQREELGLNLYPSVFELLYPQLGMPAVSLALETELFQGGEEIMGYTYIMNNIKNNIKKVYDDYNPPPVYEPSRNGYVLGLDGEYMFQHNSIFLSEDEDSIIEKIETIENKNILKDWLTSAGHKNVFEFYSIDTDFTYLKTLLKDILVNELKPFRENQLGIDYLDSIILSNYEKIKDQLVNHIGTLKKGIYKMS